MNDIGTSSLSEWQAPDTRSWEIDRKDRFVPQSCFVVAEHAHDADDREIDLIGTNLRDTRLARLQAGMDCRKPEVVLQNYRAAAQSNSTSSSAFGAPIDDQ